MRFRFTILFIFMLNIASAQLYLGPKTGVVLSYEETFNDDSYPSSTDLSLEFNPSLNVAGVLLYQLGVISLQFEPSYIQLKGTIKMADIYGDTFNLIQFRNYWRNNFLISIGGTIKNRVRLYGQGGVSMGFLLNSGRSINDQYYFNYKNIKSYDVGLVIGVGALIRIKNSWLELSARLNQGLIAYKTLHGGWLPSYYLNQNMSFNIAYVFLISKNRPKPKKKDRLFY